MRFDISENGEEYDILLNEEYIGKALSLEECISKIRKIMEAIKNGEEKVKKKD